MTRADEKILTKRAQSAEQSVAAFEALPMGEAWAEPGQEATAAVAAFRGQATNELFPPDVVPIGGDLIADLSLYTEALPAVGYGPAVAALHASCLDAHPALAFVLRGSVVLGRVAKFGSVQAVVLDRSVADMEIEAVEAFQHEVAGQLHARGDAEPWSETLAETVPDLEARIRQARRRHEDHAAAELARAEQEAAEAARVLEQQLRARIQSLVDRLHNLPQSLPVNVPGAGGSLPSASTVAQHLLAGGYSDGLDALDRQVTMIEAARAAEVPA